MTKKRLTKEYERDFSLILEEPWAQGLISASKKRFGATELPFPFIVFFVDKENLQIWEHRAAMDWFMDKLLEKNREGTDFMRSIIVEYKEALIPIERRWQEGPTADKEALCAYMAENRRALECFSLWYYSATDDRTPPEARQLAIDLRNSDDYFATSGIYLKGCVATLGGARELANLVYADEFPNLPDEAVLRERASGVVSLDGVERHATSLEAFAALHPEYEFIGLGEAVVPRSELQGQPAYIGNVRGPARIVKNEQQMRLVREGDIMISPMTTPDFLPAMKLAAGFVTDEGGITCHAAIVARELKKPCLIGTKVATKSFRDGDIVEIDTRAGIVRKI